MGGTWRAPVPNPALMWILGFLSRWLLLRGLPVLRHIPGIRDLPIVRGYFRVREIRMGARDDVRLRRAVGSDTAAFLAPNHPEFGTDWIIDKEVSTMYCPRMASWAARGIVAGAPGFWGANHLIANDGGDAARAYSVERALAGDGVLLHPEGSVRWTGDHVHPLYPGVAQMALRAAAAARRPTFIVPLAWKLQFVGDVSHALNRDIRAIAAALMMPAPHGRSLAQRFRALQVGVLARQMRRMGYQEPVGAGARPFFERQAAFQAWLVCALECEYQTVPTATMTRRIERLQRAIRERRVLAADHAERARLDAHAARADEAARLGEFTEATYGGSTLTQEQIAESLKRIRARLVTRHWRDALANMLPRPYGPRVLHLRVPDPIAVHATGQTEAELLQLTRERMQGALDEITAGVASDVARFAVPNPFV